MEEMKAGKFYVVIARYLLHQRVGTAEHDITNSAVEELLESRDFWKIEECVKEYMNGIELCKEIADVVQAVFEKQMMNSEETREEYLQYAFFGTPFPTNLNPVEYCGLHDFGEMAYYILHLAHQKWMRRNMDQLTNGELKGREYRFLPFELLGWKTIELSYRILYEVVIEIWQETVSVRKQYEQAVQDAYSRHAGKFLRDMFLGPKPTNLHSCLCDCVSGVYDCLPVCLQSGLSDEQARIAYMLEKQVRNAWAQ